MFVSPCTLRSTQCAALIALATVAGIARVETNPPPNRSAHTPESPTLPAAETRSVPTGFFVTPTASAPWLQPFAQLTLWLITANDRSSPDLCGTTTSTPDRAPVATLGTQVALSPNFTEPTGGRVAYQAKPRIIRDSRAHLIPFAVGPPRSPLTLNLRANGTPVPTVDFARRLFVSPVAHFSFRLVARLACGRFSRHLSVGPDFSPSFALRGAPGSLPAPTRFRPSRCADEPRGGRLFPL